MSYNNLIYDNCAFRLRVQDSVTPLEYNLFPGKYNLCNKNKCMRKGDVDRQFIGRRVDIETDLRNQTRLNSLCPEKKYIPCTYRHVYNKVGPPGVNGSLLKTSELKCGNQNCKYYQSYNPFACERYVTLRHNLKMPDSNGINIDVDYPCNGYY